MMRIKLFEDFKQDAIKLEQDIKDILVELSDDGFEIKVVQLDDKVVVFIDNYDNFFCLMDIYEPVMTLISFMKHNFEVSSFYYTCGGYNDDINMGIEVALNEFGFDVIDDESVDVDLDSVDDDVLDSIRIEILVK